MPIVLAHDSGDPAKLCNIEFSKPVQAKQCTCLPNAMVPISQPASCTVQQGGKEPTQTKKIEIIPQ
jgi:hypothetical protein